MSGKNPWFPFYPGDWLRNANLRRCSLAERGAWIEVMCLMHDADSYGVLRWPLREIAAAAAVPMKALSALADKGVIKGCDSGTCPAFTFTPKTNRRENEPVILLPEQEGPVWYSSRMLKDEHIRRLRGAASANKRAHFDGQNEEQNESGSRSKTPTKRLQSAANANATKQRGTSLSLTDRGGEGDFDGDDA